MRPLTITLLLSTLLSPAAHALDVKLDAERDSIQVIHDGKLVTVKRIQDTEHEVTGDFARTSRKCPHFCIQPMHPAEGVKPIGEIELFDFMENQHTRGEGVIIDARLPSFYGKGTIPGSINIPFTELEKDKNDPDMIAILERLGVKPRGEVSGLARGLEKIGLMGGDAKNDNWDFTEAKQLVLWCNGPWCGQSPRAIRNLVKIGYPAEKIFYYRGGMQAWQILGLSTVIPKAE